MLITSRPGQLRALGLSSIRTCLAFLSCFCISAIFAHGADTSIQIESEVGGWALDERSGRVFASLINESVVVEYAASGKELQRIAVSGKPAELLVKKDKLVVACTENPKLEIIDLGTSKVVGSIAAGEIGPYALFASQVDNPYVYFYTWNRFKDRGGNLFQVNLSNLEFKKNKDRNLRGGNESHIVMSPDGKWILADTRWPKRTGGWASFFSFDEESFSYEFKSSIDSVSKQISVDSYNRFWGVGGDVITLDTKSKVKEFAGDASIIHPTADLITSLDTNKLLLQRFTDGQAIGEVELTDFDPVVTESDFDRSIPSFSPLIKYDLKNHHIFVGTQHHAYWIELKQFSKKIRRKTVLQAPFEQTVSVGVELRLPIFLNDKRATSESPIALVSGQKNASIIDGSLVWTPTPEEIGETVMTIEYRPEDPTQRDRIDINMKVLPMHAKVGFFPTSMVASLDGKYLLAWGQTPQRPNANSTYTSDVAVIDTANMSLIHHGTINTMIDVAMIDSQYVYYSSHTTANGTVVARVDHQLTNPIEYQDNQRSPIGFKSIGENVVAVMAQSTGFFHADSLKLFTKEELERAGFNDGDRVSSVVCRTKFIHIGRHVYDRATGNLVRITGTTQAMPAVNGYSRSFFTNDAPQRGWGRVLVENQVLNHMEEKYGAWEEKYEQVLMSAEYPVFAGIRSKVIDSRLHIELDVRSLTDGKLLFSQLIYQAKGEQRTNTSTNSRGNKRIVMDRNNLYTFQDLYVHKTVIPMTILEEAPVPPHFSEAQSLELDVGENVSLPMNLIGDTEGCEFKLGISGPFISVDSKTGAVTLETKSIWQNFLEATKTAPIILNSLAPELKTESNASAYETVTRQKLEDGKFVIQQPVEVTFSDGKKQNDSTHMVLLLKGPKSEIDEVVAERAERRAKMIAEQKAKKERDDLMAKQQHEQMQAQILKARRDSYKRSLVVASFVSFIFLSLVATYGVVVTAIIIYFKIGAPKKPAEIARVPK